VRVVVEGTNYDFSVLQGKNLEADLKKRDFTINALAVSLTGEESWDRLHVLDVSGGLTDLAEGVVRLISTKSLSDDPLRMLRAYRLAAVLNFRVEEATCRKISRSAHLIQHSAVERIVEELDQIFETPRAYSTVLEMDQSNLLDTIFPELRSLKGVDQNGHHHLDVFHHTLETLRSMELFTMHPERAFPAHTEVLKPYLKGRNPVYLKWYALFHDMGKPWTKKIREDGKISFPGHAHESAVGFRHVALRMKLNRIHADLVARLIELHLRPLLMAEAMRAGYLTPKGMARLVCKVGNDLPGLFLLAAADDAAKQGFLSSKDCCHELNRLFGLLLEMQRKKQESEAPILTGADIITKLGLKPGPLVGKLLRQICEAHLAGEIETKDEALFLAQQLLKRS
jgi:tRNA nucleotidyltransferase/poly(A) polymerase